MSRRSEIALIVYTLAVVLLTFVQAAHEAGWEQRGHFIESK
jgi:hypothetical protein